MKKILLLTAAIANTFLAAYSQNVPSYVPTDGLVGWWPFNGNANDESGNGNNGTVNGANIGQDRNQHPNSCYEFNGSDNITVPNSDYLNVSELTLSCWVISNSNNTCIISKSNADNSVEMNYQLKYNDEFEGQHGVSCHWNTGSCSSISGHIDAWSEYGLTEFNSWMHILAVVNEAGQHKLYINGEQINQYSGAPMVQCNSSNSTLRFGGPHWWWDPEWFIGSIDDIGIWNRALTESEIQQLYEGCNVQDIAISGNNTPAALQPATYTCTGDAGSTYTWSVTNGVITSGQGTNSVNVVWAETGLGSISVQETTTTNCTGEPITLDVVVIPTSVNELSAPEIRIYPNPASKQLSIAKDASLSGKSYSIYNATGSLVLRGKLVGRITSLSLEEFAPGQYTLHVEGSSPKNFAVVKE
jgi:hypothetical protein